MEEDMRRNNAKSPHFFKIILHDSIRSGELVVPKKFARKYGADLSVSDVVLLRVPTGDTWEVGLRKGDDGAVWLQNGWLSFASFYSVEHGHFLVFRYVKRSCNMFDVIVFDKSATEIEYPVKCPVKVEDTNGDNHHTKADSRKASRNIRSSVPDRSRGQLKGKEKAEALERAKSFKSSNPYLPIVMQHCYVYPPYRLDFSGRFLDKYMGRKKFGEVKLQVSGDKIWNARYQILVHKGTVRGRICGGWRAFAVDNNLVLGDVCVFELIRGLKSVSFKVAIFRAPPAAGASKSGFFNLHAPGDGTARSTHEEGSQAESGDEEQNSSPYMTKANTKRQITRGFEVRPASFVSDNPFFQLVMTKSYVPCCGSVHIPGGFARQHVNMKCREQIITLEVGDRSWPVKLISDHGVSPPRSLLSGGFPAFARENSLKIGDLCMFELIQREDLVFRVTIQRVDYKRITSG